MKNDANHKAHNNHAPSKPQTKTQKLIKRATDNAKQIALKTFDDKLEDSLNALPNKVAKGLSAIPDVPVVSPLLKPKLTKAVDKISTNLTGKLAEKARKQLNKKTTSTDVLIIGAGISGIGMASKLKKHRPFERFMILERRADMGGTWDLFQYPGIRSDSDMTTFGFADYPWHGNQTLASGGAIKSYLKKIANTTGVTKNIRYGKSVEQLNWSSEHRRWFASVRDVNTGEIETLTAKFVIGATGYYDYSHGYQPEFAGQDDFAGQIIHPQAWQKDTTYHDKKVLIIGSGATAVTMLPALLDKANGQQASHVTMLQRSPTYVASVSSEDNTVTHLTEKLNIDKRTAYEIKRWKNILIQQGGYHFARQAPKLMQSLLKFGVKRELKGSQTSLKHFTPNYKPWDERICAVPDADLFHALKSDKADIITDQIEHFTKTGVQLKSGKHIEADIIVTATGLQLQMLGGASLSIDNKPVNIGEKMTYKAVLVEDIPNMAVMFGYTNASWTLKVDLASTYVTRLLKLMQRKGYKVVTPVATKPISTKSTVETDGTQETETATAQADNVMGALHSGYVQRANDILPKQGDRYPWQISNNYLSDCIMLQYRKVDDDWLRFEE